MTVSPQSHAARIRSWSELLKCVRDPLHMARLMGYDRINEEFHGPMMREMWLRDLRRPLMRAAIAEQVEEGLLPEELLRIGERAGGVYEKNEGECWSRDHFKTTVFIVRCAKNILLWPEITIAHWHAVEAKAIECSMELGDHFFTNKEFRALRPEIMPSRRDKRFSTAAGFTVERRRIIRGMYQKKERHPTFFPKGAGAEVTGGHAALGWLDDIVGQSTIDDSAMPKIRNWLGNTVSHVIRTDGGWLYASYTPWDEDDVMTDWENDKALWDIRVRACMETDGKPDYDGTPVLYDKKYILRKQRDPLCNFPYQMMCDRVPDSERRWPVDWDNWISRADALKGDGQIFVLSDPAPMGLSLRGDKDKVRGDTGKDWWSIAVVRLRVRGDFQDLILLDGAHSQSWTQDEGYDVACRLMRKWRTRYFLDEDYSGGQLFGAFLRAAKRANVMFFSEFDGKGRRRLPQYKESYQKNAKKQRFQKLCDRAAAGEVWICRDAPEEYVHGDRMVTGAFTQINKWIPRRGGESNLKWDDDADAFARATDSKLQEFAPQPNPMDYTPLGLNPGEVLAEEETVEIPRTRYGIL